MIAGIDFGTTNSVICRLGDDGEVHTVRFEVGGEVFDVFRSVLNFWEEARGRSTTLLHAAGPAAIQAYLEDPLGSRLIMSMKTYLAQRSFVQTRIFGRTFRLEEMVGLFLSGMLGAAGSGLAGRRAVVGRPVRFAGESADDALGEQRLRASFASAGFADVFVALEPEGAGHRFIRTLHAAANVLVGDFGGGTSDFSIFRFEPGRLNRVHQLGHAGVGIAGDTFDYRLIDRIVCPLLGKDDSYRIMGKDMPIPISFYRGLSQWHRLSLMRAPRVLSEIEEVARTASRPERLRALLDIIKDEAGYDLYRAISTLKARLSREESVAFAFRHGGLDLVRDVRRAEFEEWIAADLAALGDAVDRLLASASLPHERIDHVFLTGGTSFVPAVRRLFETRFGAAKVRGGGEFVSVAEGLALIGQDLETAAPELDRHRNASSG
jgi:hypothetical chaperone protein